MNPSPSERRPSTDELLRSIFREAAAIVSREFARPPTVDEVARRVATSPRQLHRAFSQVAGMSFRDHVTEVRMTRAADLLASTDILVGEVARSVGYRDPSQFTKAFTRAYGMTPSALRASRRGSPS